MLGTNIYNLRKANSMNQEALATELNVSRQAISKWERDESVPDLEKLAMLAKVFNVTIDELLGDEYNMDDYQPNNRSIFEVFDKDTLKLIALGTMIITLISILLSSFGMTTMWTMAGQGIAPTINVSGLFKTFIHNYQTILVLLFIMNAVILLLSIIVYTLYRNDCINKNARIFILATGVLFVIFDQPILGLLYVFLGIVTSHKECNIEKRYFVSISIVFCIVYPLVLLLFGLIGGSIFTNMGGGF